MSDDGYVGAWAFANQRYSDEDVALFDRIFAEAMRERAFRASLRARRRKRFAERKAAVRAQRKQRRQ